MYLAKLDSPAKTRLPFQRSIILISRLWVAEKIKWKNVYEMLSIVSGLE